MWAFEHWVHFHWLEKMQRHNTEKFHHSQEIQTFSTIAAIYTQVIVGIRSAFILPPSHHFTTQIVRQWTSQPAICPLISLWTFSAALVSYYPVNYLRIAPHHFLSLLLLAFMLFPPGFHSLSCVHMFSLISSHFLSLSLQGDTLTVCLIKSLTWVFTSEVVSGCFQLLSHLI